jgi:hypothetical protein
MELQGISPITLGKKEEKNDEITLSNIGKSKVESLQKSIYEINELIEQREELSEEIFEDGEKTKIDINNFILANEKADNSLEKEDALIGLRQKKVDITELQLNEKVTCWKDVAMLKKELREKEEEFTERVDRLNTINDLLE